MSTTAENSYVWKDEHGALRVGGTQVPLDSIVAAFEEGHSPEAIRQQYPSLSLEEVYGAIAYCLGHPEEVRAYLESQGRLWDEWRRKARERPSPVVERLRALRASTSPERR
jgi:uncharacterized protein (DUF433 family)